MVTIQVTEQMREILEEAIRRTVITLESLEALKYVVDAETLKVTKELLKIIEEAKE